MFNIDRKPQFTTRVEVTGFGPDKSDGGDFSLTFRVCTIDEYASYDLTNPDDLKRFLRDTVVDGDQLVEDNGQAVGFTPELLNALINWPDVRQAMLRAYHAGLATAAQGN